MIPMIPPVVIPVDELDREAVEVGVGLRLSVALLGRESVPEEKACVPPETTVSEREVEVTTEAKELDDRVAGTVTVSGAEEVMRLAVLAIVLV